MKRASAGRYCPLNHSGSDSRELDMRIDRSIQFFILSQGPRGQTPRLFKVRAGGSVQAVTRRILSVSNRSKFRIFYFF